MTRLLLGLLVLGLAAAGAGCTTCSQAYDYCPPTFTGDGCGPCDPMARANSILSAPLPITSGGTVLAEEEVYWELGGGM